MTDILKFQLLLNSINTDESKFTTFYCEDEHGWYGNETGDNTPRDYIAINFIEASDIHIIFDKDGNFLRFAHHG